MLREGLAAAYDLGVNPALLTCEVTNVASRRVIEINGGQLEDQRGGKLRFWIPTR
jgi:predicted acetyltransferase